MTATAGTAGSPAGRLGFRSGQVIQEWGYDEDVDQALRDALVDEVGVELVDEDYGDVIDSAIVWWRGEDGDITDLTDLLVDATAVLEEGGLVWVLVPKMGSEGHVPPSDIGEAATTAGLQLTTLLAAASAWLGVRLTGPKGR